MIRLFLLLILALPAMAIEKPEYELIEKLGDVEIRSYQPMIVARTEVSGEFGEVGSRAFRKLAGYIFGDNSNDEKISMTAPVSQSPADSGGYFVTFMMPSKHDLESLPEPASPDIELVRLPARQMAVIRYRGGWGEKKYRDHESELIEAVSNSSEWEIAGKPTWARFDPPIMPSFLRTNEVLVPVRQR